MNEVRRPPRRDSPALPTPTRLLYLAGASAERDASTLQQLSALTGQVQVTTVGTAADVEQKIRSGGYHALVISHAWPQADTLSLISSLRRSNAPIAIVPVVTETQRDLYASAVAVGADDVLILLGGTLLHPTETLVRVRQSRYLPPHEVEAVRAAIRGQHVPPAPATGHPPAAPDHVESPAEPLAAGPEPTSTSSAPATRPPGGTTPHPLSPQPPAAPPPAPVKPTAFASIAGAADHDAVRRDLERRLREAESEGSARREAHAALVASKLELERAVQAHASAREVWEREREELLTEARSAVAATTVVESRLQAALADVERLSKAHASAEAAWDTAEAAHASERAGWDQTRQALEQRLEAATALAASRDQLERAVGAAEAALRQATEAHAAERATWEAARRELEQRATDTTTASEARRAAESALDDARAALRSAEQARTAEREDWDRERAQLEARVQDIGAARGARGVLESEVRARETELATAMAALETERAAAAGSRERLTALQAELDVLARARDQLEQALDAARADLRQLNEARANDQAEASRLRDQLERALDSARSELRQLNDARVADQADATEMRRQLEHALDAARNDLRETGEARARDQADVARVRDRADALQAELDLATKARTEIDDRLRTAEADLQQAVETLAATRAAAQAAREALETKLSETESAARAERSDLERRIAALGTDLQQAIEAGASDRLALEVATEQLRAQRAEIASIAAVHADADATLARARADRDDAAAREATARQEAAAASQTVRDLEAALKLELEELGRARDAAREELDRTVRDHTGAAAAWEERRRAFEADLAALNEARATERMDWMTARLALETRLSQADDELDRQREETETLRAELGRVAARYDRLSRSELFGYGVTTLDGWLVHCNDAFARLLGYSNAREALASASEQAFGADGSDVISADSLVDGQVRYRDAVLTRVDGESVRVLQSALLITGGGQDALVERIVLDLSDRTALEERLREAQRLEALGRLTAAMAPELEALAAVLETGMPAPLDVLDEGADALPGSAVAELRQLVAFTRKQARPAALLDVNDALERLSPMLARLVSSHVEFALRLGSTALIAADDEDFEQMTTALVVAARDHLTAGGSLLIETGMIDVGDTDRRPPVGHRSGSGAVLTVTAAGYGVQPTDPSATLEAVVERLAGTLLISGVPGRRVTLRVDLPRIR